MMIKKIMIVIYILLIVLNAWINNLSAVCGWVACLSLIMEKMHGKHSD